MSIFTDSRFCCMMSLSWSQDDTTLIPSIVVTIPGENMMTHILFLKPSLHRWLMSLLLTFHYPKQSHGHTYLQRNGVMQCHYIVRRRNPEVYWPFIYVWCSRDDSKPVRVKLWRGLLATIRSLDSELWNASFKQRDTRHFGFQKDNSGGAVEKVLVTSDRGRNYCINCGVKQKWRSDMNLRSISKVKLMNFGK